MSRGRVRGIYYMSVMNIYTCIHVCVVSTGSNRILEELVIYEHEILLYDYYDYCMIRSGVVSGVALIYLFAR